MKFLPDRLNASNEAAEKYISQFPLPAIRCALDCVLGCCF